MASLESGLSGSGTSTPRSGQDIDHFAAGQPPRIRFMCSFGGKILPRPRDNHLRYVGGDTRIVSFHRHINFATLISKFSKLTATKNMTIKYQLPNEDLDALITVTTDEDVENMMEEYNRLSHIQKSARLRLFLFPTMVENSPDSLRDTSINSLLDGSAKRENWFADALNGGQSSGPPVLERDPSEVSSVVSDCLFGLDSSEVDKLKNKTLLIQNDNISILSDPDSPVPAASTPSEVNTDLPRVRIKPINAAQLSEPINVEAQIIQETVNDKTENPHPAGYASSPIWRYATPAVPAVYYVPGGHLPTGSIPVPIQTQFLQPIQMSSNHVYSCAAKTQYEMPLRIIPENTGQPMFYAATNHSIVPGSFPGMATKGSDSDSLPGRGC